MCQPGRPGRRGWARPRSPAPTPSSSPSTARSRGGRACPAGRRRRRAPCRRCSAVSARRTAATSGRRSRRHPSRPRRRRRDRRRPAARSARGSPGRGRSRPARRWARSTLIAASTASSSWCISLRQLVPVHAALVGLAQDLVVDVGDVADEVDLVALVGQPAAQHVEVDRGPDVTDVRLRLHRETADVDARLARLGAGRSRGRRGSRCRRGAGSPGDSRGARLTARIRGVAVTRGTEVNIRRTLDGCAASSPLLAARAGWAPWSSRRPRWRPRRRRKIRYAEWRAGDLGSGTLQGTEVRRGRVRIAAPVAHPDARRHTPTTSAAGSRPGASPASPSPS